VASSAATSNEWEDIVGREHVVGDVIWPLANILWRIYAEVSERRCPLSCCLKASSGADADLCPAPPASTIPRALQVHHLAHATRGQTARFPRSGHPADGSFPELLLARPGVVILLEMRQAKFWLDKAMRMCPQGAWQQRRCVRRFGGSWMTRLHRSKSVADCFVTERS
jgi:hypothetical protein